MAAPAAPMPMALLGYIYYIYEASLSGWRASSLFLYQELTPDIMLCMKTYRALFW